MKEQRSNIREWLRRWHGGQLDAESEREWERHAQGDPFLADALAGYRALPEGEHAARVERLRDRLAKRSERERGMIMLWPRLAAAAAAVAGLMLATWLLLPPKGIDRLVESIAAEASSPSYPPTNIFTEDSAAIAEALPPAEIVDESPRPKTPPTSSSATEKSYTPKAASPTQHEMPKATSPAERDRPQAGAPVTPALAEADSPPAQKHIDEAERDTPATLFSQERAEEDYSDSIAPIATDIKARSHEAASLPQNAPASLSLLRGKVIDLDGKPIARATAAYADGAAAAFSDPEGQFFLRPQPTPASIIVSAPGFSSAEAAPSVPYLLLARLRPIHAERHKEMSRQFLDDHSSRPTFAPIPENGWESWDRHLDNNMRYPSAALAQRVEGSVLLEFGVDQQGRPIDARVLQSLGYGCDEEALRLLGDGPDWVLPHTHPQMRLSLPIIFRLP